MTIRTAIGLTLLLVLMAAVSGCGGLQSAPPRSTPAPGDLIGLRIEVHEAPG
ncbi:MAG: hypothetical protein MUQ27_08420 [Acidimicrobiia bacterium]|nr:hypothetical protein [Acidimicrobiia bacterium]